MSRRRYLDPLTCQGCGCSIIGRPYEFEPGPWEGGAVLMMFRGGRAGFVHDDHRCLSDATRYGCVGEAC